MNEVVTALPRNLVPRQMTSSAERLDRRLKATLTFASLANKVPHPRPAMTVVVGAIRQGEKQQLLTGRKVKRPHGSHHADAHDALTW